MDWLGTSPVSADELLAGRTREELNPRDQAVAFLVEFLAAGPRTSREIWQAAQKADHSSRRLDRAKTRLGIRCRRIYSKGRPVSYWLLPGQEIPSGVSDFEDIDRYLAEMEKEFPPRTPLDGDEDANDFP